MSRYIDADALMDELQMHADSLDEEVENARKNSKNYTNDFLEAVSGMADGVRDAMALIYNAPSIEIVRCAECKYKQQCHKAVEHTTHTPTSVTIAYRPIGFCSYGEREGE